MSSENLPMEMTPCGAKETTPRRLRRESIKVRKQQSFSSYLEVPKMDENLERFMKSSHRNSRRSLHDEVFRSALSLKQSLTVPVCSNLRRHSCNDTEAILDRVAPLTMTPNRRNSQLKRSASVVSSRSRRGSKYYSGVERRPSHLSGNKKSELSTIMIEDLKTAEAYRKELKRRRIVWLVIGMFFFILTVSVLIVVITLTHRMDIYDNRRRKPSNCT